MGLLVAVLMPAPANAADVNGQRTLQGSGCTAKTDQPAALGWWGGTEVNLPDWPRGTVQLCYTRYRGVEIDPYADYYAMVARSQWTRTDGQASLAANMFQDITSSEPSLSNVYESTDSVTSSQSCDTSIPITVGINVGVVALAIPSVMT